MLNNKRTASIIAALFFLCHVPCTEVCADKNESLQWNEFQDDSVIWHYLFSPDSKEKPCENDAGVMAVAVKINGKKFNPICIPSDDDSNAPTADSIFTIDVNFDAAKDLVIIYSWEKYLRETASNGKNRQRRQGANAGSGICKMTDNKEHKA